MLVPIPKFPVVVNRPSSDPVGPRKFILERDENPVAKIDPLISRGTPYFFPPVLNVAMTLLKTVIVNPGIAVFNLNSLQLVTEKSRLGSDQAPRPEVPVVVKT